MARHAGFNDSKLISEMSARELRKFQRGAKKGSEGSRTPHLGAPSFPDGDKLGEQSTRSPAAPFEEPLEPRATATAEHPGNPSMTS